MESRRESVMGEMFIGSKRPNCFGLYESFMRVLFWEELK